MAKIADKYYLTDPWQIIEEGFNPDYSQVSESIFSLGNEYMGIRGYFDEGYSGKSLIGSYFNGIFEVQKTSGSHYKGMIDQTEFIVNTLNYLYLRIQIDDEIVDLHTSQYKDFRRTLDLHNGILYRTYTWVLKDGRELKLDFERFLSMKNSHQAAQRVTFTPVNFSGEIKVTAGIDYSLIHHMANKNFWYCKDKSSGDSWCSILAETMNTGQSIYSYCRFECEAESEQEILEDKKVLKQFVLALDQGVASTLTRVILNISKREKDKQDYDTFNVKCIDETRLFSEVSYESMRKETSEWWSKMWEASDIVIEGDPLNQQGIRYCIFQMHQTYHGSDSGTIIGAKGLTGEAYSGNTFWDTETYCLPFYLFNNPEATKNLLMFRYLTLPEAKERANVLDCKGAFYPIATISGKECCSLWQHANLQLQASTAVAYGFWHYENITGDSAFIQKYGLPILIEISRMLACRGDYSSDKTKYGYYGVMGPDEFQMMVNHNCYTNFMAKETLLYTLEVLNKLKQKSVSLYDDALKNYHISNEELETWRRIIEAMYIPYREETKLFEQHEGYFDLPHIEVDEIPIEDFPLYHHWSYDRIYRNDMIKQPDILMLMLLYNSRFTTEQLLQNYEYYEPRCIHESSLSPSVHSILAAQLKKHEEAYSFFGFATRMDLDNYNRNTGEGLHTTSIAAAWMNIVYGFGGMRSDGEMLSFSPSIPVAWNSYSFRLHYRNDVILVTIEKDRAGFYTMNGSRITVKIYESIYQLGNEATYIQIPKEWRG